MDKEILIELREENNEVLGNLYREYFGMVNSFVTKNSGTTSDAEDIFQDAMIVLVGKIRNDNFELTASLKTYVMAVSKNLWFKRLRTSLRETSLNDIHSNLFFDEIESAIEEEQTLTDKLKKYLLKITKHCSQLIHDIFYKEKTIEQIQSKYGYSTRHNAANQKHKCIKQIKKVKEQEISK